MTEFDSAAFEKIDEILDAMILRRLGGEDRDWWEALYWVGGSWRRVSVALPRNRISPVDVRGAARARANAEFLRWVGRFPPLDDAPGGAA